MGTASDRRVLVKGDAGGGAGGRIEIGGGGGGGGAGGARGGGRIVSWSALRCGPGGDRPRAGTIPRGADLRRNARRRRRRG